MRRLLLAAVILIAWHPGVVFAEDGGITLDLDNCMKVGLANNLRLRNARLDRLIALEKASAVDALYNPRLSLGATLGESGLTDSSSVLPGDKDFTQASAAIQKAFTTGTRVGLNANWSKYNIDLGGGTNSPLSIPPYSSSLSVSLSQSLLRNAFGEIDRGALAAARRGREIARDLFMREEQLLSGQICAAYWDLYAAKMAHSAGLDSLARAQTLLANNRARKEDGLLDETDVLAAEALVEGRKVEVLGLRDTKAGAADRMRMVLQVSPEVWDKVSFVLPKKEDAAELVRQVPADVDAARRTALLSRPDLAAARGLKWQAGTAVEIKRSAMRPDLELIGSVGAGTTTSESGESFDYDAGAWTLGLQLEIPLGRGPEKSEYVESTLNLEKSENNVKALEAAIDVECRAAARNVATAYERVVASGKVMLLQRRKLALEQKKFQQGRSATQWVVRYEEEYARSEMSYYVGIAQHLKTLAAYQVVQGKQPAAGNDLAGRPGAKGGKR